MKPLIKPRERVDKGMLIVAGILLLMPISGLWTGTAFSPGFHGSNYQEFSLEEDPEGFWFLIKLQLWLVGYTIFYSKFSFPLFSAMYQSVLSFKHKHKVFAYLLLYIVTPIVVVTICLLLMYVFID